MWKRRLKPSVMDLHAGISFRRGREGGRKKKTLYARFRGRASYQRPIVQAVHQMISMPARYTARFI